MRNFVFAALVLGLVAGYSHAAEVSPTFDLELSFASSNEFVTGIVILESPIDMRMLDLALHAQGAKRAQRYSEIYNALHSNADQTQPRFLAELEVGKTSGLVEGYTAYWIENLFVVRAKPEFFNALRHRSDIRALSENFQAVLIEPIRGDISGNEEDGARRPGGDHLDNEQTTPGQDAIGATRVNRELGITGQGVLVANLDTGVDGNHPALASRWRGLTAGPAAGWLDVLNAVPTTFPSDNNNHGTHVMGTICGRAISGNDTNTVGSAPNAEWIACNAIDQGVSNNFNSDVLDAYQWFANPDGDVQTIDDVPDIVQNSWGVNQNFPGYTQCWDLWNTVIVNLEALGCVVTFSAGNEGPNQTTHRSPAIHAFSEVQMFSVGAVDVGPGDQPPYAIASFSSRGPSPCAGTHIKPEIVAPGVNVYSSVPGGGYNGTYSGTSMAGPHVAGIVALMREACPDCDPITIKEALISTAIDSGYGTAGNDNTFGYGFIDGWAAVNAVFNLGTVYGVVTTSGDALPDVNVTVVELGRNKLTDAAGGYSMAANAGSYTLEFTKFGYLPVTINNVLITVAEETELNVPMTLAPVGTISGFVFTAGGQGIPGAAVEVLDAPVAAVTADNAGFYSLTMPLGNTYTLRALGDRGAVQTSFLLTADTTVNFLMPQELFCFDFEPNNQGWTAGAAGDNATTGIWGRMDPEQTVSNSIVTQPEDDHTETGVNCFVTNGIAGATPGANDVDGGKTTLLSPIWDLSAESNVVVEFFSWYSNDNGNNAGEDYFDVDVSNDGGSSWTPMLHEREDWEEWRRSIFFVDEFVSLTSQMRLRFVAQDQGLGSLVEAAVDDVCILASGILPPEHLTVLVIDNGVQLNWSPVAGADTYTVWHGVVFPPTSANTFILGTVADTTFVDLTNLETSGYYIVTANR